jgi:hypothetical protein
MQVFDKKGLAHYNQDYMVWWALLESVKDEDNNNEKLFTDEDTVKVVFQMNGVDLDFRKVMNNWQNQIVRMINDEAEKLLLGKLQSLNDLIEELKENVKTKTQLILGENNA